MNDPEWDYNHPRGYTTHLAKSLVRSPYLEQLHTLEAIRAPRLSAQARKALEARFSVIWGTE